MKESSKERRKKNREMINHYHFLLMRSVSLWNLEIVQSRLHNLCLLLSLPKLIGWKYFWSCIYLITTKTFTENWDSRRHLLELSWPIYSFTKFYSQQMLKISAVVSKWAKRVPTDGALLSQFSGKVLVGVTWHEILKKMNNIMGSRNVKTFGGEQIMR